MTAPKQPRRAKTPRQRALEALGVSTRKVEKAEKRVADTHTAWEDAKRDLAEVRRRHEYVTADPALPQEPEVAVEPEVVE